MNGDATFDDTTADFELSESSLPPARWDRPLLRGWPRFLGLVLGMSFVVLLLSTATRGTTLVDSVWLLLLGAALPACCVWLWEIRPGRPRTGMHAAVVSPGRWGPKDDATGLAFLYDRRRVLATLFAAAPLMLSSAWLCGVTALAAGAGTAAVWPGVLTLGALTLTVMLVRRSARRLRNPRSAVLTHAGLELTDGPTSVFTPWENIADIAPSITRAGPRVDVLLRDRSPVERLEYAADTVTGQRSGRYRGMRRLAVLAPLMLGRGRPAYVYYALAYYWRHGDARWELATGAAVARLRACQADLAEAARHPATGRPDTGP